MPKTKDIERVKETAFVEREREEIADLEARIAKLAPEKGNPVSLRKNDESEIKFSEYPLSKLTLRGLARGNFEALTEIQRQAMPHALAGRDILGAAKTGSGKTLAFLIPLVEDLFRQQWSREDGIGALVVSPTRELALQIYEVLRVLLHYHAFTCGLLVGGVEFEKDKRTAYKSQVIVCTPGRILQHLEQTPNFDISASLRILVLDEADRLLDMGFEAQIQSIISYLPSPRAEGGPRQTMLFSATQTKSLKDLARLSLSDPEYVAVHAREKTVTPEGLRQLYVECALGDKVDLIYSFLKSHLKSKIIMFFTACRQVQFIEAVFRRMRPGLPVMALHGRMGHSNRVTVYEDFCSRPAAVMFATDVAARGLDFPNVDWVVQMDCPEDVAAYIHRVGRTARYNRGGNALLVLLPSEKQPFLKLLEETKVPVKRLGVNPMRKQSIGEKLRSLLIADPALKELATKGFKSYLRSVHLQPNQEVFEVGKLSFKELAASYGLASAPRIKFNKRGGDGGRQELLEHKNRNYTLEAAMREDDDESEDYDKQETTMTAKRKEIRPKKTDEEKMLGRKPKSHQVAADENEEEEEEGDDDDLLVRKAPDEQTAIPVVSEKPKKTRLKPIKFANDHELRGKKMRPKLKMLDDDNDEDDYKNDAEVTADSKVDGTADFVARAQNRLQKEDLLDRAADRKRVQEKHKSKKLKTKLAKRGLADGDDADSDGDDDDFGGRVAMLGSPSDDDEASSRGTEPTKEIRKKLKRMPRQDNNPGDDGDNDVEAAAMRLINNDA